MNKKLYLVDGYALIYRAYFALAKKPLTNSQGIPSGALYGFANYLLRLIESYQCPYLAVVLDSGKPTFRHEMYGKYKANREAMPDDLQVQIPIIKEFIAACNIPIIIQDGLEADDLIATLTHNAVAEGFEVFLVTRDKDLMQLVGDHVSMLAPEGTGILQSFTAKDVEEKLGVSPVRVLDYLSLIGDASDNIPGVPGVGPKTALKILALTEGVDTLLADTSVLKNEKLIQKIEENRELLLLSKALVTLKKDAVLAFTPLELARQDIDKKACTVLLRQMECSSLLKSSLFAHAVVQVQNNIVLISTVEQLEDLAAAIRQKGSFTLNSVTTGMFPADLQQIGLSIAISESACYYIPLDHADANNLNATTVYGILRELLTASEITKNGHDLKTEWLLAQQQGVDLQGLSFDCMVAAYLIDPGKRDYTIESLADQWLEIGMPSTESLLGKGKTQRAMTAVAASEAALFWEPRITAVVKLQEILQQRMAERSTIQLFEEIEMPLVTVLAHLEWQGIRVDVPLLKSLSSTYSERLALVTREVYALAGEEFNLNSPKQIGEVLFDRLGLPAAKKTKSGTHATGVEILEKLASAYPIAQKILDSREIQKLLSTYIDALPEQVVALSQRVHTTFNQTVAATGRLSSTHPNLQNIPIRTDDGKRIREAFIAAPGSVLIAADYSQIELRILAHLSKDPLLTQAFLDDQDIHTQTASVIYGVFPEMITGEMRRAAKTINFGLMYGMGPINLSRQLNVSFHEARQFIDTYFAQFPTIKKYMDTTIAAARELGYTETLLARRRYLPEINAANRNVREGAERTAINTPVQGTAADIIKIAMITIEREISTQFPEAKMILQVHDELLFEVSEEQAEACSAWVVAMMSGAYTLSVPLKVDAGVGKNWCVAH